MPLTTAETANIDGALKHTNGVMLIRVLVGDVTAAREYLKGKPKAKAIVVEALRRPAVIPPPVVED